MAVRVNKEKEKEKTQERTQKDAEMVSEYAKDARNRKEANTISNKLESELKDKEGKLEIVQKQEQAIENILDETKDNIKLTTRTATKELPQLYTKDRRHTGRNYQDHERNHRWIHRITKRD